MSASGVTTTDLTVRGSQLSPRRPFRQEGPRTGDCPESLGPEHPEAESDSASWHPPLLDPASVEAVLTDASNFFHLCPFLRAGAAARRGSASTALCNDCRGCDGRDDGDESSADEEDCTALTSDLGSGEVAPGPVIYEGGVATAGPDPPRLSPPDPHSPSFLGAVGPAFGTFGCPC